MKLPHSLRNTLRRSREELGDSTLRKTYVASLVLRFSIRLALVAFAYRGSLIAVVLAVAYYAVDAAWLFAQRSEAAS